MIPRLRQGAGWLAELTNKDIRFRDAPWTQFIQTFFLNEEFTSRGHRAATRRYPRGFLLMPSQHGDENGFLVTLIPEARLYRLLCFPGAVPLQPCAEIIAFLEPTTRASLYVTAVALVWPNQIALAAGSGEGFCWHALSSARGTHRVD